MGEGNEPDLIPICSGTKGHSEADSGTYLKLQNCLDDAEGLVSGRGLAFGGRVEFGIGGFEVIGCRFNMLDWRGRLGGWMELELHCGRQAVAVHAMMV